MHKEFKFLPVIQMTGLIEKLRKIFGGKVKALFYIGGNDVLTPPLEREEEKTGRLLEK